MSIAGGDSGKAYLLDQNGLEVNPATEEKQDDVISALSSVTNANEYTSNSEVRVYLENHICSDNTSSTPLGIGGVFTGEWQDCLNYQEVNVSISTDKNSATDGLEIQWSDDKECVCDTDKFTVYANAGTNYTPNPAFRYVRLKYTNGSVAQGSFRLMTILRRSMTGGSFHRITDTLKDDSDARLGISVLKLRTAQDTYVSGSATNAGNFKVSLEELESDVKGIQPQADSLAVTLATDHYDTITRAINTIEYEHHEIHAGSHYFICDYDSSIADSETIEFVLTTPNTTSWTHMSLDFSSTLGVSLEVYEGASAIVGGTSVTAINNNRNSTNTSGMTILKDPTSITDGTRIAGFLAGANRTGGFQQRDREIILKQNTTYLFRFTSLANSNAISFCGEWYEHTNKTA